MKVGDRIELIGFGAPDPDPIASGTKGTVSHISPVIRFPGESPFQQISVKWDNGRTLMLCCPPDQFKVIHE
jgi:hypothetical protein